MGTIRAIIRKNLSYVRQLLPFTRIIRPNILLRLAYLLEKEAEKGKLYAMNFNHFAHKVCSEVLGGNAHVTLLYTLC